MKFLLNQEQKDRLIILAKAISGVKHASFDSDYGDGYLYIQKEGADKAETIHWVEFLIFHASKMIAITANDKMNPKWWTDFAKMFITAVDVPIEDMVHPVDEAYRLYVYACKYCVETGN